MEKAILVKTLLQPIQQALDTRINLKMIRQQPIDNHNTHSHLRIPQQTAHTHTHHHSSGSLDAGSIIELLHGPVNVSLSRRGPTTSAGLNVQHIVSQSHTEPSSTSTLTPLQAHTMK